MEPNPPLEKVEPNQLLEKVEPNPPFLVSNEKREVEPKRISGCIQLEQLYTNLFRKVSSVGNRRGGAVVNLYTLEDLKWDDLQPPYLPLTSYRTLSQQSRTLPIQQVHRGDLCLDYNLSYFVVKIIDFLFQRMIFSC